jgi:hypothetical protein
MLESASITVVRINIPSAVNLKFMFSWNVTSFISVDFYEH